MYTVIHWCRYNVVGPGIKSGDSEIFRKAQMGPEIHPASFTMAAGYLTRLKRRDMMPTTHSVLAPRWQIGWSSHNSASLCACRGMSWGECIYITYRRLPNCALWPWGVAGNVKILFFLSTYVYYSFKRPLSC